MSKRSQQIDAFFHRGQQHHLNGRLAEAEQIYRRVIAAMPRHADALHALGALALQAGQAAATDMLLGQAKRLKPAIEFQLSHASALMALNRPENTARLARSVLRGQPHNAGAHQILGHALSDGGHPEAAIEAYRTASRLMPDLPDIGNSLGMVLRQASRLAEAELELRRAGLEPEALANLSSVQKERGAFADAEATLRQALSLAPDNPVLRYNWSLLMLLLGRTYEAWDGWEQRFRAGAIPGRTLRQPQWQGEPLGDRALLVHTEQGLGDVLQFARYLPGIKGNAICEAPPRLIRLLAGNPAMPKMIPAGAPVPACDCVFPLLSLPARTRAPAVEPPYLFADPDRVAVWKERLGGLDMRVGINWQGFPGRFGDKGRSFPFRMFKSLAGAGVRLISLQKGAGEEQIPEAGFAVETLGELDAGPDAFIDTAAQIANLDLIIRSNTSIAHLARALGYLVWDDCAGCRTGGGCWSGRIVPSTRQCGCFVKPATENGRRCSMPCVTRCRDERAVDPGLLGRAKRQNDHPGDQA